MKINVRMIIEVQNDSRFPEPLQLGNILTDYDLDEIMPCDAYPATRDDLFQENNRRERRLKFVDMLGNNMAYALLEGLHKAAVRR